MNIKQLRYFVTASECLNYSHTAAFHYTTKRSITYAIKCLEEEFHLKLFVIEGNRPLLTADGVKFAKKAKRLLTEFDQLVQDFTIVSNDRVNQMCIGIDSRMMPNWSMIGSAFNNESLLYESYIEENNAEGCLRGLYDMKYDLAFVRVDRFCFEGLGVAYFRRYQIGVVLSATHPLSEKSRITLSDLADCNIVASHGHQYRYGALLSECRCRGFDLKILSCVDDPLFALDLIMQREAASLVAIDIDSESTKFGAYKIVPLEDTMKKFYLYDCAVFRDDTTNLRKIRNFLKRYVEDGRLNTLGFSCVDPLVATLKDHYA